MPVVPTYDAPQVQQNTLSEKARLDAPQYKDYTNPTTQSFGEAMQSAGNAGSQIANDITQQANQTRVTDGMNQAVNIATDLKMQALQLQGKNALERPDGKALPDELGEKFKQSLSDIEAGLGNDAQKQAFRQQSANLQAQLYGTVSQHMVQQQKQYRQDTQLSTIDTAVNQAALLWGDPSARQSSTNAITHTVDEMAQDNGWDKATRDVKLTEAISPMHAAIIKGMIQAGDATGALDYYNNNSASMTIQARAALQSALHESVDMQKAESAADQVWSELGPQTSNDPVKIFDMEKKMREVLGDNPAVLDKGIAELRSRAQAFNAQQSEEKSSNISGVWKLVDAGTPMSQIARSDAWLALDDTQRHDLRKAMQADREDADAKALRAMKTRDELNLLRNGDKFLTANDPNVLSQMSRAQVEATRGTFGFEGTQHLLQKWDELRNPKKLEEARMDDDDFKHIADGMGLHPFGKDLSEDDKRQLGELKFRVENVINNEQMRSSSPLSRDQKMKLARDEMARTVSVKTWGGLSSDDVPAITLSKNQLKNVVIPPADRAQIAQVLALKYKQNPNNKDYAPTEENMRKIYLAHKSRAGALINGQ